ncbi:MAG: integration host factor subunit alpha [Desulfobacterales bacterium]
MTLTKSDIVANLTDELNLSRKAGTEILETLLEIIKKNLENGDDVLVSGYGKFCVKEKTPRRGRNPSTGEDMTLPKRKVVVFRCSHILREKINGG